MYLFYKKSLRICLCLSAMLFIGIPKTLLSDPPKPLNPNPLNPNPLNPNPLNPSIREIPASLDALPLTELVPLQTHYQSYLKSVFLPRLSIHYQYINRDQQSHQSEFVIIQQQEEQLFLLTLTWQLQPILDPYLFYQRLWYQSQYQAFIEQQVEQQPLALNALAQAPIFQPEAFSDSFDQAFNTSIAQGIDPFQVDLLTGFTAVKPMYPTKQGLQKSLAIRHQLQLLLAQRLEHLSEITQLGLLVELKKQALLYQLSLNPYHP